MSRVGVVIIGRNEGERLARCLASLEGSRVPVVYVDSGSTDGSPERAAPRCDAVVRLDTARPFTAARARNAGSERLIAIHPEIEFVQFVDGDCEMAPGWMDCGSRALEAEPRQGVVFGRLRERHPDRSLYNRLCDIEWNGPVGPARACGGNAMMRVAAFRGVGGFDGSLIAGEEPELCVRLRAAGWGIARIDAEMGSHDAAMTRFRQWWRRTVRVGWAYGEGRALHGRPPESLYVRQTRSAALSGFLVPAVAVALAPSTRGWSLGLMAWYPLRIARFARACARLGLGAREAWTYSAFCTLAAFPHLQGMLMYLAARALRLPSRAIEYKDA